MPFTTRADEPTALDLIARGNVAEDAGDAQRALQHYDDAVSHAPALARAHLNRGNALMALGRTDEAIDAYLTAVAKDPSNAGALFNLGNAYLASGRHAEAAGAYERSLGLAADRPDAHYGLGFAVESMGRLEQAVPCYRSALALDAHHAQAASRLAGLLAARGDALNAQRRPDDAIAAYREALLLRPDWAELASNLGCALTDAGRIDEAIDVLSRAAGMSGGSAIIHRNLANALLAARKADAAMEHYRIASTLDPSDAESLVGAGNVLYRMNRLDDAITWYRKALDVDPGNVMAWNNVAIAQIDQGLVDDAARTFERALAVDPESKLARSNLLFLLSHDGRTTPEALFAEHRRFGAQYDALTAAAPPHANGREPGRVLRVGFVSADLREHAVAQFLEPVLPHLAANPGLELFAYYNHANDDDVTARLRPHFRQWTRVCTLSDEALADAIRKDRIDILIDLSGHSSENRLPAFARKPAPIQASWLGFPGTTGLQAMDYYLATRAFLPPERFASQFTERLVCLPASAPFQMPADAPPVSALPALHNGFVTFASFNRVSKLRPAAIALWARLLHALPTSRLVIAGLPPEGQYQNLNRMLEAEGLPLTRIRFEPRSTLTRYLALHREVDICLDAFPYTGGTTTFYALHMGVPTLTLAGATPASRQGAAVLACVGLDRFTAHDADSFQQLGLWWASHQDELAALRAGLRQRCERSLMRRPDLIAQTLDAAFRHMWSAYCANRPPEAFEIPAPSVAQSILGKQAERRR